MNLKNQGVSKKESNDIVVDNSGENREGLSWRDEQKIVELGVLAEALGKCCGEDNNSTLDLRNTEHEIWYGFASILWVRCLEYGTLNSIKIRKSHHINNKGVRVYDLNTKTSGAMINFGLSVTGMQKHIASIKVPPFTSGALKKRERETGITKKQPKHFVLT